MDKSSFGLSSDEEPLLCCVSGESVFRTSDDGSLRGGQVDGLDADGQRLLQVLQYFTARAVWGSVVEQLFEGLQLNQDHHVLQEIALDVGRQVWSIQKLQDKEKHVGEINIQGNLLLEVGGK